MASALSFFPVRGSKIISSALRLGGRRLVDTPCSRSALLALVVSTSNLTDMNSNTEFQRLAQMLFCCFYSEIGGVFHRRAYFEFQAGLGEDFAALFYVRAL